MNAGDTVLLLAKIEEERREIREKMSADIEERDRCTKRIEVRTEKLEELNQKFENLLLGMFQNKE